MTDQELREIDQRVALALGGRISETAPYWYGVETKAWTPIPKFTTKAASVEWVKKWLRGKGWGYAISRPSDIVDADERDMATAQVWAANLPDDYIGVDPVDETALCLAFLAAVEAEKASVTE